MGRRVLCARAPTFFQTGPCTVEVDVSLNGVDFVNTGLSISINAPEPVALIPNCGPVAGGTTIQATGKHLYNCSPILVAFSQGDSKREEAPEQKAETHLPAVFLFGPPPAIEFSTSACAQPGPRSVRFCFDPQVNPWTDAPLTFNAYADPVVTALEPNQIPMSGSADVTVQGTGFIPSDFIRIRLRLAQDELAALKDKEQKDLEKERLAKEKEAAKKKAVPPKSGKKTEAAPEPEPEPEAPAEPAKPEQILEVLVPAVFRANLPEPAPDAGDASAREKATAAAAKAKKPAKKEEVPQPTIVFVCPAASSFGETGQRYLSAGCSVEMALALNGQQFTPVVSKLKFKPDGPAGSASTGPKKK